MRLRYFEQSITREWLTVWPLCDVPAPARQHRYAVRPRQRDGALRLRHGSWRHHADRHYLVMRRVCGVPAPREAIEPHVAGDFGLKPAFQSRRRHYRHITFTAINLVPCPPARY